MSNATSPPRGVKQVPTIGRSNLGTKMVIALLMLGGVSILVTLTNVGSNGLTVEGLLSPNSVGGVVAASGSDPRQMEDLKRELSQQIRKHHDDLQQRLTAQLAKHQQRVEQTVGANLRGADGTVKNQGVLASSVPGKTEASAPDVGDLTELYRRFDYRPPRPHSSRDAVEADCGSPPDFARFFAQTAKNHSANGEDRAIYENFFRGILPDGVTPTYLELGAYNGRTESNSRFFDVCLGWNGLLVEANPHAEVWHRLIHNRPTAHRLHMAASCSHDDALHDDPSIPFHAVMWTNAAQKEGTTSAYTDQKVVDVPCGSLTPFIQDLLGGRVTFFSLDVEGAEPLVLEHVDFHKIRADVVIIEKNNNFCQQQCESRDRFRAIMDRAGYVRPPRQFVTKSDLYVHPESPFAKLVLQ